MKNVLYLTYSDSPRKRGFVFPNELQDNSYSIGIWAIEMQTSVYPEILAFDAVDNNQLITLHLQKINGPIYKVDTLKHGVVFFRLQKISKWYEKYVGNSDLITNGCSIIQVIPLNYNTLEKICKEHHFFFVGTIETKQ